MLATITDYCYNIVWKVMFKAQIGKLMESISLLKNKNSNG